MSTIAPPPASPETSQTRTRLLLAALKLFSEQGYAKTSIRAIAAEAQANVAAVSYYFGDKAALYAALFSDSFGSLHALVPDFTRPGLSLRAALRCFFQGALGPLHHGAIARQVVRLHIREMLEPTAQWQIELERDVRAPNEAMAALLCRHLGLAAPDDDLHRLTLTLTGMAFQLWGHQEVVAAMQPHLLATPEAVDRWAEQLTEFALAMVATERRRRARAARPAPSSPSRRRPPAP